MKDAVAGLLAVLLLAPACRKQAAPEPPAAPAAEETVEEAVAAESSAPMDDGGVLPGSPIGAWRSEACGERAYPREIQLSSGFHYTGRDLVSPCPPDARCVWSGIVEFAGTWEAESGDLVLHEKSATEGRKEVPRPDRLHFDRQSGTLYEKVDDQRCLYERIPSFASGAP